MRCKLYRPARCNGGGRDHPGGERGPRAYKNAAATCGGAFLSRHQ